MRTIVHGCVALLALSCGRTPFGDGATVGEGGLDASGGDTEDAVVPDGEDPDAPGSVFVGPPDLPSMAESCGNGRIDPGELCYLPQVEFPSRIDPCALAVADFDLDGHLSLIHI